MFSVSDSVSTNVMQGGASTSTFSESGSEGVFNGTVRIVQFLKAPGFAKVIAV